MVRQRTHARPEAARKNHALHLLLPGQQLGTFMIEREPHLAQALPAHGAPQRIAVVGIEQQKTTPARAHQLPADGAVLPADVVPAIDAFVAGAGRTAPSAGSWWARAGVVFCCSM